MSEGDVQQVINALRGTLSKDNATRTQSSEALVQVRHLL